MRELNRRYGPTPCNPLKPAFSALEVRELGENLGLHWTYCDQNCIEVDDESDPPRRLIMGEAHNRPWAANHPGARRPGLAAPVLASPRCVLMAAR